MALRVFLAGAVLALGVTACAELMPAPGTDETGSGPASSPETTAAAEHVAPAHSWTGGRKPEGAEGTRVAVFADQLHHPRWLYVLPNGDVLVAETGLATTPDDVETSADRISLLRDTDSDGIADLRSVFLEDLRSPLGMVLIDDEFYVANTDSVVKFPYREGQIRINASETKIVDLPTGSINRHWARDLIASQDGSKLYVAVGSNGNVGEHRMDAEQGRAAIWEVDLETREHRIFASGLRNPVAITWELQSGALWALVNERGALGEDYIADYLTSVQDGAFYGWPYSYSGQQVDRRAAPQRPELVDQAIAPDHELEPGTVSTGLANAIGNILPARFAHGMFISQHGTNADGPGGYRVIFVPFRDAQPVGEPLEVLSGFVDDDGNILGRPMGLAIDSQGGLLVADDEGKTVWRVTSAPGRPAAP